ncbi:hypothetical protein [Streptomyces sp. NBC_00328]|uniref:hypothetical protein n=1 Tax=Streptomyces sp. NBC_00328 TaxID=2903646 RepID=UPI002E286DBE|nr:hypothetical protein [Streptomyces sp. NBC_00328]
MAAIPSEDLAASFARLGGEDDRQVWSEPWDDSCHQGCVGSDSFTALPYLAEIADGRAPGEPDEAVELAGLIASAADDEHSARYAEELAGSSPPGSSACAGEPPVPGRTRWRP